MQGNYKHEISFIDLGGPTKICLHHQFLVIKLNFIIKRSLIVSISNRLTPITLIIYIYN